MLMAANINVFVTFYIVTLTEHGTEVFNGMDLELRGSISNVNVC